MNAGSGKDGSSSSQSAEADRNGNNDSSASAQEAEETSKESGSGGRKSGITNAEIANLLGKADAHFSVYYDPIYKRYTGTAWSLNTWCSLTLYTDKDAKLYEGAAEVLNKYERMLSRTIDDSEVSRLNRREISEVSPETAELIEKGLHYSEISGGEYDIAIASISTLWDFTASEPVVPDDKDIQKALSYVDYHSVHVNGTTVTFDNEYTGLDLGSIAKGYIAERLKDYLVENGVESGMISLGGNIVLIGSKPDGSDYGTAIRLPFGDANSEFIAIIRASNCSLVTSGIYERYFKTPDGSFYHHILDPETGYPFQSNIYSVSILGPDSGDCDALSTTLFSLGTEEGMKLINSLPDYYAVFYLEDGTILLSDGLTEAFSYEEYPHEHYTIANAPASAQE